MSLTGTISHDHGATTPSNPNRDVFGRIEGAFRLIAAAIRAARATDAGRVPEPDDLAILGIESEGFPAVRLQS